MDQASKDGGTMFDDSTFEDALDKVISLARKARSAEIDAGACGTGRDFDKMYEADNAAQEAKDAFLARFSAEGSGCTEIARLRTALKTTVARLRNAREAVANVALILGDVD